MKGVVFTNMPGADTFPSIAFGSGTIQKEDTYRYAKRDATGKMRRIDFIGYVLSMDCKWQVLTRTQYETLIAYITQTQFNVQFRWQGSLRTKAFYAGNVSSTPFKLDSDGTPRYYRDVSFNIITVEVSTE